MTNAPTAHSLGASRIAKVSTLDFSLFIIGGVAVVVALRAVLAEGGESDQLERLRSCGLRYRRFAFENRHY